MLQCSGTFVSCDRSPLLWGRSAAKYPLLHALGGRLGRVLVCDPPPSPPPPPPGFER